MWRRSHWALDAGHGKLCEMQWHLLEEASFASVGLPRHWREKQARGASSSMAACHAEDHVLRGKWFDSWWHQEIIQQWQHFPRGLGVWTDTRRSEKDRCNYEWVDCTQAGPGAWRVWGGQCHGNFGKEIQNCPQVQRSTSCCPQVCHVLEWTSDTASHVTMGSCCNIRTIGIGFSDVIAIIDKGQDYKCQLLLDSCMIHIKFEEDCQRC